MDHSTGPQSAEPRPAEPQSAEPNAAEQSLIASRVSLTVFGIVALMLGYAITLYWDSSARRDYVGYLSAPVAQINSKTRGLISQLNVGEGDMVHFGQELFGVSDLESVSAVAELEKEIANLRGQLVQKQAAADVDLAWRTKNIQSEILAARLKSAEYLKSQFDQQIQQQAWNDYIANPRNADEKPQKLFQAISHTWESPEADRRQAIINKEAARNAVEVSGVQLKLCEQQLENLKQLQAELPKKVHNAHGLEQLENELQALSGKLATLKKGPAVQPHTASQYGQVTVCWKKTGEAIDADETVLEIIDREKVYLTVQIPTGDINNFEEGAEVELVFPGDVVRHGRVQQIPLRADTATAGDTVGQHVAVLTLKVVPVHKSWPEMPLQTAVLLRAK